MASPSRHAMSRTEEWLRSHEEWPVPNDDLRAKIINTASTAQVHAQIHAQEKSRSQVVLVMSVIFCGAITWIMQDIAGGMHDPQSSALLAVADDGWARPIDQHMKYLTASQPHRSYDWALVQAHITWRRVVLQRLSSSFWQ
jgi:hypothetical protein